ncbi:MAG TPA: malectin domain-containing carbohydrate-binding protein [Puia sp.]|nr:malectin domain-containing carbohydrate-binding protein [Puia sp.]
MGDVEIREETEKAELETLLASGIFSKAPNLAKLLRYICDRYWRGELDSIKEYSLGVEALGRPQNFDPSSNAIVRVEAHRLREKLRKYYETTGADHKISISLQPGSYIPQFTRLKKLDIPFNTGMISVRQDRRLWVAIFGGLAIAVGVTLILIFAIPRIALRTAVPTTASTAPATPTQVAPGALRGVGILAGYFRKSYIDRMGNLWLGDRYFEFGSAGVNSGPVILGASDPTLFETYRMGDFSYNIPLKPGDYELWLYFVETLFGPGTNAGGGDASRMFQVKVNGRLLLNDFDIISDAGANFTADERVFKDIHPAPDGYLHIAFIRQNDAPLVNAIRVVPSIPGRQLPVRIVAQDTTYTDPQSRLWGPDRFFTGGRMVARRTPVTGVPDPGLYAGERFGNFTYAIPAAPGKYVVTLHFCEQYFGLETPTGGGGGIGSRVFDVYCNGKTLLQNFDIFKEAGGIRRPVVKTFHGIEPDAQGKIMLRFSPIVNYPLINAIEVHDESKS